jgi:hypothetical protein
VLEEFLHCGTVVKGAAEVKHPDFESSTNRAAVGTSTHQEENTAFSQRRPRVLRWSMPVAIHSGLALEQELLASPGLRRLATFTIVPRVLHWLDLPGPVK